MEGRPNSQLLLETSKALLGKPAEISPYLPADSNKIATNSNTSSLFEYNSVLNTEEENKSEAENANCLQKNEKIELYSAFDNHSPMFEGKLYGHNIEISTRYRMEEFIAQGASGMIFCAEDKFAKDEENRLLAIKKIERAFEHKMYARKILRELRILRLLKHENIIEIKEIMLPKSRKDFRDIYIVTELMDTDLHGYLNSEAELTSEMIQFFLYQLLRGLKYIHSANIIHRDLKPKNLLLNSNCQLKICDFGSSKTVLPKLKLISNRFTDYVVTRWYRAPELLLSWKIYTSAVDLWSVGCILAEMVKRRPLFKGEETYDQIKIIIDFLGTPSEEEIECIPNERTKNMIKKFPKKPGKSFEKEFPKLDPQGIDLLRKLLTFNPEKRITAEEALKHPYLSDFHCEEDEPVRESIPHGEFEYETGFFSKEEFKDLVYEECLLYHFPAFREEYLRKIQKNQSVIAHIKGDLTKTRNLMSSFESEFEKESSEEEID